MIKSIWSRWLMLLAILATARLVLTPSVLHAKPCPTCRNIITVNTLSDDSTSGDGLCSVREAIDNSNSPGTDTTGGDCVVATGKDTIKFSVNGTITLGSTLPIIANISGDSLSIDGSGQEITIDGSNDYQVLGVDHFATLNVNNLTISNGSSSGGSAIFNFGTLNVTNSTFSHNSSGGGGGALNNGGTIGEGGTVTVVNSMFSGNSSGDQGGGIFISGGTVTVSDSTFTGNDAEVGGGIFNSNNGSLTITNCIFSSNSALFDDGGGVSNDGGTVTVSNSTFSGNVADGAGGIFNNGSLTVSGSTFSGNISAFGGGAISNIGAVTITNSTFSGNSANSELIPDTPPPSQGGAIFTDGTLSVTDCTFLGNSADLGGAIENYNSLTVSNSVLAESTSGGNCNGDGLTSDGGYNISDDDSCDFRTSVGANGQTIGDNVNPLLDPTGLQNNGGPTETIALEPTSPAIAAVPLANCTVKTDQRGAPRPAPGYNACDIGAFEYGAVAPIATPTRTATAAPTATATSTATATPTATPTPNGIVTLTPASLHFGTVIVGENSTPKLVTFNNGTAGALTIRGTTIGRDYKVVSTTCAKTLNSLQSCDYSISFEPQRAGTKNETFMVSAEGSHKVALNGVATRK